MLSRQDGYLEGVLYLSNPSNHQENVLEQSPSGEVSDICQLVLSLPEKTLSKIFGRKDQNLKKIERTFRISLSSRGSHVVIKGEKENVETVRELLTQLSQLIQEGVPLNDRDIQDGINISFHAPQTSLVEFFHGGQIEPAIYKLVQPRSLTQRSYLEAIRKNDIVLAIGPAGTGKTYLAVGMACAYLLERRVKRIILTRPAVEAGEKLGFLPGDIAAKVNPYLRPLYDALYDLLGYERVERFLERGIIEIAPLAFMRGRTLNDAFIILDEAQNTTQEQMKMFLTRMGFSSKMVITGDITQIDLPEGKKSGLKEARVILDGVPGIAMITLDERDVVRHPLVQDIITAYERVKSKNDP